MNKSAFVFVAASALVLAACGGGEQAATDTAANASAVTQEAVADVNSAEAATNSALDANADVMANESANAAIGNGTAADAAGKQ